jgi:hypothetical protein
MHNFRKNTDFAVQIVNRPDLTIANADKGLIFISRWFVLFRECARSAQQGKQGTSSAHGTGSTNVLLRGTPCTSSAHVSTKRALTWHITPKLGKSREQDCVKRNQGHIKGRQQPIPTTFRSMTASFCTRYYPGSYRYLRSLALARRRHWRRL